MSRPVPYSEVIIDPMNEVEVQHWAKEMQLQAFEIRAGINLVGPRLVDLRRYFGRSAHIIILENKKGRRTSISSEG
jgi:hypothetical protein